MDEYRYFHVSIYPDFVSWYCDGQETIRRKNVEIVIHTFHQDVTVIIKFGTIFIEKVKDIKLHDNGKVEVWI